MANAAGQAAEVGQVPGVKTPVARPLSRHWKLGVGVFAALVCAFVVVAAVREKTHHDADSFHLRAAVPPPGPAFANAFYQSLGVRFVPGHQVKVLLNGEVFDALADDIGKARSSINVVLYIWEKGAASDRMTAAIVARARAGVSCRILVDDLGSSDFAKTVEAPLAAAGCDVRIFRPRPGGGELTRNHRKIVVIDGATAFTGGFGVRDDWLGDGVHGDGWRDTSVRFTGPAVADAQQAFAENWQEAGGALLPEEAFPAPQAAGSATAAFVSTTASPTITRAERLTQLVISSAKRRIWIENAYFVPSRAILDILHRKASEGVDVRILAPGKKSDSKTSFGAQHGEYGALMKAGVRVWEYQPSMMHAKTMIVDDALALVGSINLDPLSLNMLEDGALVVSDQEMTATLATAFDTDCRQSRELSR